jgi:hypothetical protein
MRHTLCPRRQITSGACFGLTPSPRPIRYVGDGAGRALRFRVFVRSSSVASVAFRVSVILRCRHLPHVDVEEAGDDVDFADVFEAMADAVGHEVASALPAGVVFDEVLSIGVRCPFVDQYQAQVFGGHNLFEVDGVELGEDFSGAGAYCLAVGLEGGEVDLLVELIDFGEVHAATLMAQGQVHTLHPAALVEHLRPIDDKAIEAYVFDPCKMPEVPDDGVDFWMGPLAHFFRWYLLPEVVDPVVVENVMALDDMG